MSSRSCDVALGGRRLRSTTVALLFVGSGFAALVYEVAWFHLLRLVIGASWISLGILLATFMGGMCLGSVALPFVVPARFHPLRVYGALELAIGAIGCTLPWWLPWISRWYLANADESITGISARAMVAAVSLLPATMLMGATLPAVARWVRATPAGLSQLGIFYGANIFGAVAGCLAAGFVLLPNTDVVYASNFAAAINMLVAAAAIALSYGTSHESPIEQNRPIETARRNAPAIVCAIAALSGFAALAAEVVWTRLLALLFGSTVYTFAVILAVFLAGLGIGSFLAAYCVKWAKEPLRWLAAAQLAIVCLVPLANHTITRIVPFRARPAVVETQDIYAVFWHDTQRAAAAILPAAIFWGASFPLALAAAGKGQGDTGRLVGQVYAANTLGAIFGALLASIMLIPLIGSQRAQQVIVFASGLAAVLAIYAMPRMPFHVAAEPRLRWFGKLSQSADATFHWLATPRGRLAPPVLTAVAMWLVAAPPCGMFGRSLEPAGWCQELKDIYVREGRNVTVAVQKRGLTGLRFLCIGGKVEASNLPPDLRCERLLGHLPALFHPAPKKTLTVGLGTGTTAGCFVLHPEVEEITICEIEPVVADAAAEYFAKENHAVANDPRTAIHFDDARHFLATTDQKFDVITSDPINSWIRGAAALYSAEYFELCKQHLNPGGIMVQWIPLYEKDLATAKCELATFLEAFPSATLWTSWTSHDSKDERHDIVAVGQLEPTTLDVAELDRRINSNAKLKSALEEVKIGSVPELLGQFVCRGEDLKPWLAGAEINRDLSLRLEYLAGLSLWNTEAMKIYREMAAYRRYPSGLFQNDDAYKEEIAGRLGISGGSQ